MVCSEGCVCVVQVVQRVGAVMASHPQTPPPPLFCSSLTAEGGTFKFRRILDGVYLMGNAGTSEQVCCIYFSACCGSCVSPQLKPKLIQKKSIRIFLFLTDTRKSRSHSRNPFSILLQQHTQAQPRCQQQQQRQESSSSSSSNMTSSSNPGLHHRGPHAAADQQQQPSEHSSSTQQPADVEAAISQEPASKNGGHKDVGGDPSADAAGQELQQPEQYADVTYADIFKQFSILGWTAFGGPAAHIGLFQRVSCRSRKQPLLCCTVLHAGACSFTLCN